MTTSARFTSRFCFSPLLFLCLSLLAPIMTMAQQQRPLAPEQTDDVVRISTDLIQTDVMVFDRQGKFVDGLKPEQFELRVDGRPQAISFFERIVAGSIDEDAQIAAARGSARSAISSDGATIKPLDRGRVIIFYLDDLHMAADSLKRTRETLSNFVEREMGQNDQAAIMTSSGQLGILQQLTDERGVLLTALKRLSPRPFNVRDNERTPMSEYQALAIVRSDRSVLDYFISQLAREMNINLQRTSRTSLRSKNPTSPENRLEQVVLGRARAIIDQSNMVTRNSLSGLENLVRAIAPIPARKLLFFISDGFFISEQGSDIRQSLPRITDAAARSGTVIYSVEARGLVAGVTPASERAPFDPAAELAIVDSSAVTAAQEPLYALAANTGGRALLNSNSLAHGLNQAVTETSVYYLLAWRPDHAEQRGGKFHQIGINVKGRDDLMVRVRNGFLSEPPPAASTNPRDSAKQKAKDSDLLTAIRALYPKRALPTALSVGYTNASATGAVLTASVQVDAKALGLNASGESPKTEVDVVGVLIDDRGRTIFDFEQRLTVDPSRMTEAQRRQIVYSRQLPIAPGLYQVRVATRDNKSGRTGSNMQWLEVPDITSGTFSLGSLFIGELMSEKANAVAGAASPPQALISVNRRFARSSRLLFQTYVYNAARSSSAPDVALQVQVFRDDQPVVSVPLRRVLSDGIIDLARIPYEDDFALEQLPVGRYVLRVTAIDRVAKASASQRINFEIE